MVYTFRKDYISQKTLPHWHYSIAMENNNNLPINISRIEDLCSIYSENGVHSHDYYSIMWCTHGMGNCRIDFDDFFIESDLIIFFPPMHLHLHKDMQNVRGFYISFSEDFLLHFDQNIISYVKFIFYSGNNGSLYCKVSATTKKKLYDIINVMVEEISKDRGDMCQISYLAALLSLFLFTLKRECMNDSDKIIDANDLSYHIYVNFKDCIEKNFHKVHIVKDYAAIMNVSQSILTAATLKYSTTGLLKMINMRIVLEAKRMLRYTPLRIKEISALLGFDDSSYFIKFFRRNVGMTPVDFRNIK